MIWPPLPKMPAHLSITCHDMLPLDQMMIMANGPSLTYLCRTLKVLVLHTELTITNLAMLSRMNHKRCNVLLRWLEKSGYVEIRMFGKKRYITLTSIGLEYARHMQEINEMTQYPIGVSTNCTYKKLASDIINVSD